MSISTYPIKTRNVIFFIAQDGQEFEDEGQCRKHNAKLAIETLCREESWQGIVTADDVASFIINNMSSIVAWKDDLNI